MRFLPVNTDALLVELDDLEQTLALFAALQGRPIEGVTELVPAARTVLVVFQPGVVSRAALIADIGARDTSSRVARDGKRLAQSTLELAAADDQGRIAQVSRLPLDGLAPGRYELRVQVTQGGASVARALTFRVEA